MAADGARAREKRARLEPLYGAVKAVLPALAISQQNLRYYSSLMNIYTVSDLRRMKPEQANLYPLCYAWQRDRQLIGNLIEALGCPALTRSTYCAWRSTRRCSCRDDTTPRHPRGGIPALAAA